jgi:hypothetical protein
MFSGLSHTVRYQQMNVCFIHIYQVNVCGIDIVIYVRSPDLIFSFLLLCLCNETGYTVLTDVISRLTYKARPNESLVFVYADKPWEHSGDTAVIKKTREVACLRPARTSTQHDIVFQTTRDAFSFLEFFDPYARKNIREINKQTKIVISPLSVLISVLEQSCCGSCIDNRLVVWRYPTNVHYTPTTETCRNMTDCVRNLEWWNVWCIVLEILRQVA